MIETVEQLKRRTSDLESDICRLVFDYFKDTGMMVEQIQVNRLFHLLEKDNPLNLPTEIAVVVAPSRNYPTTEDNNAI